MHLTTQDVFEDRQIRGTLGVVSGNVVRARFVVRDIFASLRTVIGGEVNEYTRLMAESRAQAMERMIEEARKLGADGIVAVRFNTTMVMGGSAEVLVTGTAVRL